MTPRLSVVVPVLNGASTLPALFSSLNAQRVDGPIEIIAVDSGSTDGSLDLLHRWADTVIRIRPDEFNHGTTRNLALSRARAELVVLLVQDVRLSHDDCLERLTRPLLEDSTLAGTFARQQARPDASALTRHYLDRWIASSPAGWRSALRGGAAEFETMSPLARMSRCTFDHVAACIRKAVWEQHPFKATPIAEDLEWAREVLVAGHELAFVPEAIVEHSHDRPASYEYQRTRLLHARLYDLFGVETIPDAASLARAVLTSMALHLRVELPRLDLWTRAVALAVAWPLGQYHGARDARQGRGRPAARPGSV
ncbi:MAG TPA: glycosyltransferase [Vicinamibacterales bacterium]|nr:glycosyltransferase [Vicinamibacterales bacterium]